MIRQQQNNNRIDVKANEILDFWFGDISHGFSPETKEKMWFQPNPNIDLEIKNKFESLLFLANQRKLEHWLQQPKSTLAYIILLDQFPRNIYRGSADAFMFDDLALAACKDGVNHKYDQQLSFIERTFFYMPLEHSEILTDQDLCVALFDNLINNVSTESARNKLDHYKSYAQSHQKIIMNYGRFPHRNDMLGRQSTIEEQSYLEHAQRFGQ